MKEIKADPPQWNTLDLILYLLYTYHSPKTEDLVLNHTPILAVVDSSKESAKKQQEANDNINTLIEK